jgi:hypothetical protein
MLNRLSFKRKKRYLWIGTLVFAFICYQLTFKKSIVLIKEVSALKKQVNLAKSASSEIGGLQKQLDQIETKIGSGSPDSINVQQAILNIVTNYCSQHDLVLKEFPGTIIQQDSDLVVQTNNFVVEGGFINALLLINLLEHQKEIGKITSTHFQTKKNFKTNRIELAISVYIQNIQKTSL